MNLPAGRDNIFFSFNSKIFLKKYHTSIKMIPENPEISVTG